MRGSTRRHFVAIFIIAIIIALLIAGFRLARASTPPGHSRISIDRDAREIRFSATVHSRAMERPFGVKGHHAIVWNHGRTARWALFRAGPSDLEIRRALDAIGARAGENLVPATWKDRKNKTSRAPDLAVDGTSIDVFVSWNGLSQPLALSELIDDRSGGHPKFDFRYGGNQRWRAEFKSGCIVCLYSCPGGAIGNRNKTIRDYERDGVIYSANDSRLPKDGTSVLITFRTRQEEQ